MHPTSSPPNPGKARRIGWGATVVAFILGYLFWLVSREWWTPSLIVFGILFAAIVGLTCRLAITHRAYDLFLAALLSLLAPVIVIVIAFGFFFSAR